MSEHFGDVLKEFVSREGKTPGQLARLTGIPKQTIVSWLDGRVRQVRNWQDLLKIARALRLNVVETNRLLRVAGHRTVHEIRRSAEAESDQEGLSLLDSILQNEAASPVAPFQVPSTTVHLVGREKLLDDVKEKLLAGGQICVLHGMGGIGKTALAQQIAYACRPHFADGVLWADLKPGNTLSGRVDEAVLKSIIDTFTEAFGRSRNAEYDLESRSRVLREVLANKNVLVVLDNAYHTEDVTYLLPPDTERCAVLITTRNKGVLRSRPHFFQVAPLDTKEGLELLRGFITETPIYWDEVAATQIVELLGGLPLAIRLVGSDLADAGSQTLNEYYDQLLDEKSRLKYLTEDLYANEEDASKEDASKNVRASFELSYRRLPAELKQLFAGLAAFPGADFTPDAAVSVADLSPIIGKKQLGRLAALSLIDLVEAPKPADTTEEISSFAGTGRYRLHPLLRAFAYEKLATDEQQLRQAREKVTTFFISFAQKNRRAYHLLDAEWGNLVGTLRLAHDWQDWQTLYQAIDCLTESHLGIAGFFDARGYWPEAVTFLEAVLNAPLLAEELLARARLHLAQGTMAYRLADFATAESTLQEVEATMTGQEATAESNLLLAQADELLAQIAFMQGQAEAAFAWVDKGLARLAQTPTADAQHDMGYLHIRRGTMLAQTGRLATALPIIQQGISLLPTAPTPAKISGLMTLGTVLTLQGQPDEALACWHEGAGMARELGDSRRLAGLWQNMGALYTQTGNITQAEAPKLEALAVYERIGDVYGVALMHSNLGDDYILRREYETAKQHLDKALDSALKHELLRVELFTRVNLARYYLEQGSVALAETMLHMADLLSQMLSTAEQKVEIAHLRAEWLLRCGETEAALAQVEQALALADAPQEQGVIWRLKGMILAALEQPQQAEHAFQESLNLLGPHNPFEMARTQLSLARWRQQSGREAEAHTLFQAADTIFREQNLPAYWQETALDALHVGAGEAPAIFTAATVPFVEGTVIAATPVQTSFTVVTLSDTALPGRTLEIVQDTLLATGGQGDVYLGREQTSGQAVVIKRLKAELVRDHPEAVRRLQQEAQLLHRLNHPNIVKLLADQQSEDGYALVMEYVPGGSLRDWLRRQPKLPVPRVLDIALELADALARTHHLSVVHRDLKPDNVLIAADGSPRLTDFGIARLAQQQTRLTQEGAFIGTIAYMSPEAFQNEPVDARADVWSFGVMLFEMLTGELPFAGADIQRLLWAIWHEPASDVLALRPETPLAVAELIERMLMKDRAARLGSMRQIAATIETIRTSL